jgi:hypothetical protein
VSSPANHHEAAADLGIAVLLVENLGWSAAADAYEVAGGVGDALAEGARSLLPVPMLQARTDEHLMQAEHPAGVPGFGASVGYPNHAGPGQGNPAKPGVPAISAGRWETDSIVHNSLPRAPLNSSAHRGSAHYGRR